MGIILSRVRKKKSTVETLEKLENDIKEIEEHRSDALRRHKKITRLFLIYSFALYIICGVFFYFQYTSSLQGKLLYLVPLALSPLLLYLVKRIISWYYVRLINKNQIRLNEMKKEKKRILEEVMDKETYKVAKEILEKFSGDSMPKHNQNLQLAPVKQPQNEVRRRVVSLPNTPRLQQPSNMMRNMRPAQPSQQISPSLVPNRAFQGPGAPALRLPAPILPLERSYVDRVVEYLIGDGPNNRYALICSQCHSHNGMALKEEFEYIGFKCCYCYFYNPARKIRPEAPKLEPLPIENRDSDSDSDSKDSKASVEASESEPKATGDKDIAESLDDSRPSIPDDDASSKRSGSSDIKPSEESPDDNVEVIDPEKSQTASSEGSQPGTDGQDDRPNCDESDSKT